MILWDRAQPGLDAAAALRGTAPGKLGSGEKFPGLRWNLCAFGRGGVLAEGGPALDTGWTQDHLHFGLPALHRGLSVLAEELLAQGDLFGGDSVSWELPRGKTCCHPQGWAVLEGKESAWRGGGEMSRQALLVRAQAVSSEELQLLQKVVGRWDSAEGTHGCATQSLDCRQGLTAAKRPLIPYNQGREDGNHERWDSRMCGADGLPQVSQSPIPPCSALPSALLGLVWPVPSGPCRIGVPQPLGPCQGWMCCPGRSSPALRPCRRG